MPAPRFAIRGLLAPPADAAGRRIAIAGVAGVLLTAPLSLQRAVAPYPVLSWLLTCCGAVLAVVSLKQSWSPRVTVARGALVLLAVFCGVSAVLGISQTVSSLRQTDQQLLCRDDVAPDTIGGGQEVLRGADPYTAFNLLATERGLGCTSYSVTPLRSGIFASFTTQPSAEQIDRAAEATLHGNTSGGLLVGFNYPAGTALLGVLGARLLVLISPLALLFAGLVIVSRGPPSIRRPTTLALGAQAGLLGIIGDAHVDAIAAALLVIAISSRRGFTRGVALGVACAIKQTAWFVAPSLLILALREAKFRDVRFPAGALLGFTALNVPFILAGPSAWITGILSPQLQPVFPFGFGPGAFALAGSSAAVVFSVLMIVGVVAGFVWCAVAPRQWAAAGIIISSLGLWIGPRSLGNYVALLGAIAVCAVAGSTVTRSARARAPLREWLHQRFRLVAPAGIEPAHKV
jgi:hypothetical protein